jgi:hypothetical protein
MLAPIALYPDGLLAQTLMAAGYPLKVVGAARWSKANPNLRRDTAVAAVKDKSWDVSVKSLTAFPQVLIQLSDISTGCRRSATRWWPSSRTCAPGPTQPAP